METIAIAGSMSTPQAISMTSTSEDQQKKHKLPRQITVLLSNGKNSWKEKRSYVYRYNLCTFTPEWIKVVIKKQFSRKPQQGKHRAAKGDRGVNIF